MNKQKKKVPDKKNLEVAQRIKMIRKETGLSAKDFAKKIDETASYGAVSNWENGYNLPNNRRLKRIAEIGGVSIEYLLNGTSEEDYIEQARQINDDQFNAILNSSIENSQLIKVARNFQRSAELAQLEEFFAIDDDLVKIINYLDDLFYQKKDYDYTEKYLEFVETIVTLLQQAGEISEFRNTEVLDFENKKYQEKFPKIVFEVIEELFEEKEEEDQD
ncbi:helix-turn-helix domain-containing protein [Enterococcus mediterraneensis]|uniref:helix-turn-helix domain-containing protein n=1 Tax=Enterococcus mediterraneensis TaxID=2364791 RepID=UPI001F154DCD|nr:helix-turn-helix transcriptional regulator [Enterococcus mediterraneensis]